MSLVAITRGSGLEQREAVAAFVAVPPAPSRECTALRCGPALRIRLGAPRCRFTDKLRGVVVSTPMLLNWHHATPRPNLCRLVKWLPGY
jgi:hypothetical protein